MRSTDLTWNLEALFASPTPEAIEAERAELEKQALAFAGAWRERDDYLQEPTALRQALDDFEKLHRPSDLSGKYSYYVWLRLMQDQNDPERKAAFGLANEFATRLQTIVQFFPVRLARIAPEAQADLLASPELEPYRHFLETCFAEAAFTLSEQEENVLTLKGDAAYGRWVRLTQGFLAKESRETLLEDGSRAPQTLEELLTLTSSQDKQVRDEAALWIHELTAQHAPLAEHELNAILADKKATDQLRGMSRPDLGRHLSDDIETAAVDTLVETVTARFDLPARFYSLKARMLGQPRLAYHERNVEVGEITRHYPYEEGLSLAKRTLGNLDPEFEAILTRLAEDGQIDVYPRPGKRGGAFCSYHGIEDPSMILLNYTEKLNDVLTLAHETGHAINFELIKRRQHALYCGTSTATAEVASTFMEDFVLDEILRDADDRLRLSLLMMKLNQDVSTIFRQIACYRFEQELHVRFREAGHLSTETIGELFRKHMAAYMGEAVEQSPGSENWWVYWSHIRSFFYVYSYSSGLLISKSLQAAVRQDPARIAEVKEFLGSGRSLSTGATFRRLGIDIADARFWQDGLAEVERLLGEAEALATRLGAA